MKREVAEEVGMEVASVRYVASQHWPFPGSLMAGCFAMAHIQDVSMCHAFFELGHHNYGQSIEM